MATNAQERSVPNAPSALKSALCTILSTTIFLVLLLPNVLLQLVRYSIPRYRVHPTWSLRRHLAVALGRSYFSWSSRWTLPTDPGSTEWQPHGRVRRFVGQGTKVTCVEVPPVEEQMRVDVAKVGAVVVAPVKVPGFWTFEEGTCKKGDERAEEGEKVVLYFAGGSWVLGHPQSTPFPYRFCTNAKRRVLAINYRKAVTAANAFPAQLLDALAGYVYLIRLGFRASNIAVLGDSSGAHIALALTRYVGQLLSGPAPPVTGLGMPGAVMLVSPSADLSHDPHESVPTDFLAPYLNRQVYPSLTRHFPPDARGKNPYFSPAVCGDFDHLRMAQQQESHKTKVWVQYGDVEMLAPDIRGLLERMRKDGVEVEVDLIEGGCHLDAGMAFALLERGPKSSWNRLLDAVARH